MWTKLDVRGILRRLGRNCPFSSGIAGVFDSPRGTSQSSMVRQFRSVAVMTQTHVHERMIGEAMLANSVHVVD